MRPCMYLKKTGVNSSLTLVQRGAFYRTQILEAIKIKIDKFGPLFKKMSTTKGIIKSKDN